MKNSGIVGVGYYVPKKKLDNYQLSKLNKLSAKEIENKTGIKFRRISNSKETASYLGYKAAAKAIENSNIELNSIHQVICCTFSGDYC